jgi:hypothetical protein
MRNNFAASLLIEIGTAKIVATPRAYEFAVVVSE